MIPATAHRPQPARWRQEWREAITDPLELLRLLRLDADGLGATVPGRHEFPLRVPRAFVARMHAGDPHDPLLRQVLPLVEERRETPGFGLDAVGDAAARASTGVIQKYDGRALLIATGSCAVHCRYCFRRHFPYAEETAATGRWRQAVAWLRQHPDVTEVILSGGDPLALATARLVELTDALRALPHLKRLRIHTRLPVVLPARVDAELLQWLRQLPWRVAVVIHANHASEIDAAVRRALADLAGSGATLLNQSVLLRGVNDGVDALAALSETLYDAGVLPYYLNLLDRVAGAAHFEVGETAALGMLQALREKLPGYLMPRLVREIAGEPYKVPIATAR